MAKSVSKPFSANKNPSTKTEPSAALHIQEALRSVEELRQEGIHHAHISTRVAWVKELQLRRFEASYADLKASPVLARTVQFFITRLYGDASPENRDAQFARIAPSIAKVFPEQVVQTAVDVAQLHALTESLDHRLACASWELQAQALPDQAFNETACALYCAAWQKLDCAELRENQLRQVLALGARMAELVQVKGLALALRMMRGPARLAQMGELQGWLEEGFNTFAALHRQPHATGHFLGCVAERESHFIQLLSSPQPSETPARALQHLLQAGPKRT